MAARSIIKGRTAQLRAMLGERFRSNIVTNPPEPASQADVLHAFQEPLKAQASSRSGPAPQFLQCPHRPRPRPRPQ